MAVLLPLSACELFSSGRGDDGGVRPVDTGDALAQPQDCRSSGGAAFEAQAGRFQVVFEVVAQAAGDHGVGIGQGAGGDWGDFATLVRFGGGGSGDAIDVRDGAVYRADVALTPQVGATYGVREVIDVAAHTYSVFVTPPGGGEVALATGYAFRIEQSGVTSLDHWAIAVDSGVLSVCGFAMRALEDLDGGLTLDASVSDAAVVAPHDAGQSLDAGQSQDAGEPQDAGPLPTTTSITQYGITWAFDRSYSYGKFANGDYWVVGPVTITGIDPPSIGSSRTMNGSMVNPIPGESVKPKQGYDSNLPAYDSSLNVALGVSPGSPLVLNPGTSLISTISIVATSRPQLKAASVLTVLAQPAAEGSFRPPYAGVDKTVRFNKSQLNTGLLPSLAPVSGTPKNTPVELAQKMRRVWLDHFNHLGDGTQYTSPTDNMPNYGREYSIAIGEASVLLMLDEVQLVGQFGVTKEDLLIGLVQIGLDVFGVVENGGFFFNNGGLNHGRKWPVLFAGIMLNDPEMKAVSGRRLSTQVLAPGNPLPVVNPFMEDQTVLYLDQSHIDATHSPAWNPDSRDAQRIPYDNSDLGLPEWGITAQTHPETSNKYWDTTYRRCCNANSWAGIVMSALILDGSQGTKALWANDAFFDYQDRFMQTETKGDWLRQQSKFLEQVWDRYRADYGTCYTGFSGSTRQYGDCVVTGVVK